MSPIAPPVARFAASLSLVPSYRKCRCRFSAKTEIVCWFGYAAYSLSLSQIVVIVGAFKMVCRHILSSCRLSPKTLSWRAPLLRTTSSWNCGWRMTVWQELFPTWRCLALIGYSVPRRLTQKVNSTFKIYSAHTFQFSVPTSGSLAFVLGFHALTTLGISSLGAWCMKSDTFNSSRVGSYSVII